MLAWAVCAFGWQEEQRRREAALQAARVRENRELMELQRARAARLLAEQRENRELMEQQRARAAQLLAEQRWRNVTCPGVEHVEITEEMQAERLVRDVCITDVCFARYDRCVASADER